MKFATHLIKIEASLGQEWRDKIEEYVKRKIEEVEDYYSADIEYLEVKDKIVEVCVFVSALFESNFLKELVEKWIENHIREEGIEVINFEIREILNFKDLFENKPKFLVRLR